MIVKLRDKSTVFSKRKEKERVSILLKRKENYTIRKDIKIFNQLIRLAIKILPWHANVKMNQSMVFIVKIIIPVFLFQLIQ